MSIKNILIHVDLSPNCTQRLRLAADLAQRLGARLIGVGLPDDDLEVADEESAGAAEARFRGLLRQTGLEGEWRPVVGLEGAFITRQARTADLLIVGQHDPNSTASLGPEEVIVASGRPVLVVPCATTPARVGDTVVIAWNGSREAIRAMRDAQPLLARSTAVIVLSVNPDPSEDWGGRGLAHDLSRRGLPVRAEAVEAGTRTISETILSRASELGADLIVMGAFRRSPLGELFFGGLTHAMLRDMTVPVLMAH